MISCVLIFLYVTILKKVTAPFWVSGYACIKICHKSKNVCWPIGERSLFRFFSYIFSAWFFFFRFLFFFLNIFLFKLFFDFSVQTSTVMSALIFNSVPCLL